MIQIKQYHKDNIPYNLNRVLIKNITLSSDIEYKNREELFINDICNRVMKSKSVLYILQDNETVIGFIALASTSIKDQPSLQVDYIFVNNNYRGIVMSKLDHCKPFRYLLDFSISLAKDIKKSIGLRYLVLSPDTDDLIIKYNKIGFKKLDNQWMYLKI